MGSLESVLVAEKRNDVPAAKAGGVSARMRALLTGPADDPFVQFARYTVVGGTAFIVDFSALILFVEIAKLDVFTAAALAFLCGLTTNYCLSVVWVFAHRRLDNRWAEFAVFGLIGVVGLGLNELVLFGLTGLFGVDYRLSKAASTIVVYLWNFLARRYTLFRKES